MRDAARQLEDRLGRLKTEARGLAQLSAPRGKTGFAPALDAVTPDRGYEAALAAALGVAGSDATSAAEGVCARAGSGRLNARTSTANAGRQPSVEGDKGGGCHRKTVMKFS